MENEVSKIEKLLMKTNIPFLKVYMKHGWITVQVGKNEDGSLSGRVFDVLNPIYGYQIATSYRI
jgi:hypothetical protein